MGVYLVIKYILWYIFTEKFYPGIKILDSYIVEMFFFSSTTRDMLFVVSVGNYPDSFISQNTCLFILIEKTLFKKF